jgi:DNA-binding transcriptional ArsR family regulator
MVVDRLAAPDADLVFQALADATRRDIVRHVMQHEWSVSELARRYPMSFAAVQKHVAVLERARLVTKHRHGREQRVSGNVDTIRRASAVLDQLEDLWRHRIRGIDALLAEPDPATHTERGAPR